MKNVNRIRFGIFTLVMIINCISVRAQTLKSTDVGIYRRDMNPTDSKLIKSLDRLQSNEKLNEKQQAMINAAYTEWQDSIAICIERINNLQARNEALSTLLNARKRLIFEKDSAVLNRFNDSISTYGNFSNDRFGRGDFDERYGLLNTTGQADRLEIYSSWADEYIKTYKISIDKIDVLPSLMKLLNERHSYLHDQIRREIKQLKEELRQLYKQEDYYNQLRVLYNSSSFRNELQYVIGYIDSINNSIVIEPGIFTHEFEFPEGGITVPYIIIDGKKIAHGTCVGKEKQAQYPNAKGSNFIKQTFDYRIELNVVKGKATSMNIKGTQSWWSADESVYKKTNATIIGKAIAVTDAKPIIKKTSAITKLEDIGYDGSRGKELLYSIINSDVFWRYRNNGEDVSTTMNRLVERYMNADDGGRLEVLGEIKEFVVRRKNRVEVIDVSQISELR